MLYIAIIFFAAIIIRYLWLYLNKKSSDKIDRERIDEINKNLLSKNGKYRVKPSKDENLRLYSTIDFFLLSDTATRSRVMKLHKSNESSACQLIQYAINESIYSSTDSDHPRDQTCEEFLDSITTVDISGLLAGRVCPPPNNLFWPWAAARFANNLLGGRVEIELLLGTGEVIRPTLEQNRLFIFKPSSSDLQSELEATIKVIVYPDNGGEPVRTEMKANFGFPN